MNAQFEKMWQTMLEDQKKADEQFPGFQYKNYDVRIFGIENENCPVIYSNNVPGTDYQLWQKAQEEKLDKFVLVSVTGLNWCTDLAPWYCRPTGPSHTACFGGAETYLKVFQNEIMPRAEEMLKEKPKERWLAGYSLAGLFAYWQLYEDGLFDRIICGSGSFWFPDFLTFVRTHEMVKKPKSIYFSLGKLESHTAYPIFNTVQKRTEALVQWTREKQITTTFVLEPGNHYDDPAGRQARGIAWTFQQVGKETK